MESTVSYDGFLPGNGDDLGEMCETGFPGRICTFNFARDQGLVTEAFLISDSSISDISDSF